MADGERDEGSEEQAIMVVELRKKFKKKDVKRLRKGRGKLMRRVEDLVEDLQAEDALEGPVVIVVREKRKKRRWRF